MSFRLLLQKQNANIKTCSVQFRVLTLCETVEYYIFLSSFIKQIRPFI